MSLFKTNELLANRLERFHVALALKFEAETGLSKASDESYIAFGARVLSVLGWPRFKELTEQAAKETITFKLPQA